MDSGIRKLSNLILYSSLWIALCSAAQVQFTYDVTGLVINGTDYYTGFVFCATLVLYAIHRIIGIRRVASYEHVGRFGVIKKYKSHIIVYGGLATLASGYLILQLPRETWIYLIAPVAISAAYVLPLSPGKMRLRDIPFLKIFLIATSWSLITTTVPLLHQGFKGQLVPIFLERFLFIIAITIPFDIRDFDVDQQAQVRTLPHLFGVKKSKHIALAVLLLSAVVVAWLIYTGVYAEDVYPAYGITMICTAALIYFSRPNLDDHYYSGLLDGMMFLVAFLYWVL